MRDVSKLSDKELIFTYTVMKEQYKNALSAVKEIEQEFEKRAESYKEAARRGKKEGEKESE